MWYLFLCQKESERVASLWLPLPSLHLPVLLPQLPMEFADSHGDKWSISGSLRLTTGGYFLLSVSLGCSSASLDSQANEVADAGSLSISHFFFLWLRAPSSVLATSQLPICSTWTKWNQVELAENDVGPAEQRGPAAPQPWSPRPPQAQGAADTHCLL